MSDKDVKSGTSITGEIQRAADRLYTAGKARAHERDLILHLLSYLDHPDRIPKKLQWQLDLLLPL